MGRVTGLGARLIFGSLLIFIFVNMLGAKGPLGEMTGELIARFPFHRAIAETFAEGLVYDISMIPAVTTSVVDDIIILLVATVISGGISRTLGHIFDPDRFGGLRTLGTRALSTLVSFFAASVLFGGIVQSMNQSLGGKLLLPILKIVILVVVVLIFYFFLSACVSLTKGNVSIGLLGFFGIRSILTAAFTNVISIYILLSIMNRAGMVAMPLVVIYIFMTLGGFVLGSLGRAAS